MISAAGQIGLRVLLAVALANGGGAHGFTHAHEGGEGPHSHHGDEGHCQAHLYPHSDLLNQEVNVATDDASLKSLARIHRHFSLFCFEFSLPPADDSEQQEDEWSSIEMLCGDDDSATLPPVSQGELHLLRLVCTSPNYVNVMTKLGESSPAIAQLPTALLSDGARLERTGVLLI